MTLSGTVICIWTVTVGVAYQSSQLQQQADELARAAPENAVTVQDAPPADASSADETTVRRKAANRDGLARLQRSVRPGVGPYGDMYDTANLKPMPPSRKRPPTLLQDDASDRGVRRGLFGRSRTGRRSGRKR